MPYPQYTPDEVAQRGEAIYERQIRACVEPEHQGQFVVIDIETAITNSTSMISRPQNGHGPSGPALYSMGSASVPQRRTASVVV